MLINAMFAGLVVSLKIEQSANLRCRVKLRKVTASRFPYVERRVEKAQRKDDVVKCLSGPRGSLRTTKRLNTNSVEVIYDINGPQ